MPHPTKEKHHAWKGGISYIKKNCEMCGKEFWGYIKYKTCSKQCAGKKKTLNGTARGKNNGMWKGGKYTDKDGYIMVMQKDHPNARSGYVPEHRLKIEKKIGRYLTRNEVVHHKNEIKSDNRLGNLILMDKKEHDRQHTTERHKKERLFGAKLKELYP